MRNPHRLDAYAGSRLSAKHFRSEGHEGLQFPSARAVVPSYSDIPLLPQRTLLDEWAYQQPYTSDAERQAAFPTGWTGTTTTDPTPASEATPQPAASPTCPNNTPSPFRTLGTP
ncbi:hypothetical protein GCM10010341_90170 [Streptomyces noursei]|nr:hypothetical protein GCM10010341_90170 [Streptomyces noursei]